MIFLTATSSRYSFVFSGLYPLDRIDVADVASVYRRSAFDLRWGQDGTDGQDGLEFRPVLPCRPHQLLSLFLQEMFRFDTGNEH